MGSDSKDTKLIFTQNVSLNSINVEYANICFLLQRLMKSYVSMAHSHDIHSVSGEKNDIWQERQLLLEFLSK